MQVPSVPLDQSNGDNQFIQVVSPRNDLKIEEVKVRMIVKDEKSNIAQQIEGTWKPDLSVVKNK